MKANKQTKKMLPARKCYVTKSVFETIKFLLKIFMEGRTVCHIINVIFKKWEGKNEIYRVERADIYLFRKSRWDILYYHLWIRLYWESNTPKKRTE